MLSVEFILDFFCIVNGDVSDFYMVMYLYFCGLCILIYCNNFVIFYKYVLIFFNEDVLVFFNFI